MSAWYTPEGTHAGEILAWVNQDAAGRAAKGMAQLSQLALAAPTTRALHEVQDVSRVVSRLLPREGR